MDTQQNCDPPKMTDADLIRAVYPRGTMKRLARAMGAPIDTARHWLYRSLSPARRRELAVTLLAEFDRQETERAAVKARLMEITEQE